MVNIHEYSNNFERHSGFTIQNCRYNADSQVDIHYYIENKIYVFPTGERKCNNIVLVKIALKMRYYAQPPEPCCGHKQICRRIT